MPTIDIGIVGTGGMAAQHAKRFAAIAGCRLRACLDIDRARAEAFAAAHGIAQVCETLGDLLETCDAVSVVVPDRFHAEISLEVLKAGRHLLCEKPLTTTLADARRVTRAWRKAGVVGLVNFSHRTGPDFVESARLVADGAIGEPRLVRSHYLQGWLGIPDGTPWQRPALLWRLQTQAGSGGVLGDLGCHLLDFTTGIAGHPKRLRCSFRTHPKTGPGGRGVTRHGLPLDANDTAAVELDFAGDCYGRADTTRWATSTGNDFALEIYGTHGAIRCGHGGPEGVVVRLYRSTGRRAKQWHDVPLRKRYPDNYQRFVTAIRTGAEVVPDIQRGLEIQAMLDACERSAASGEWVRLPRPRIG